MSLPRYASYKPSGVEWLPNLPSHWNVMPAKYQIRAASGGSSIKGQCSSEPLAGLFQGFSASGPDVWLEEYEFESPGIVLSAVGARCGKTFKAQGQWGVVANTHCLFPKPAATRDYIWYLTNNENWWERGGTAQPFIKVSETLDRKWAFPPKHEQQEIAAFLDRETAKIDALVEEQKRLIELLKEKRQAVITRAVTKGLDPSAPMKPSGVEWLGDIPAHWEAMPLKRDLRFITSGSRGWADHYSEDGAIFIRIGNLTRDSIELDLEDIQRVKVPEGTEGERTRVYPGDILFSITAYLGSVAIAPRHLGEAFVSQHVALCRLQRDRLTSEWVALVALSDVGKVYLATKGYGGTKIQLALDDVAEMVLPVPEIEEQVEIIHYIQSNQIRIGRLINEAQAAINLLLERRAALISAAVTGKIDVRGLVPQGAEAA